MSKPAATAAAVAAAGVGWRIIRRPLLETILISHAHQPRVAQPLFFHGPRGVGKTTLIVDHLLDDWNKPPHFTAYVDFAQPDSLHQHYPQNRPWASYSASIEPCSLLSLKERLESALEVLVEQGVRLGCISGADIFAALNRRHGIHAALRQIIGLAPDEGKKAPSLSTLWSRAVVALSSRITLGTGSKEAVFGGEIRLPLEETSYMREAAVSLKLAKEVIEIHQSWRREAIVRMNRTGMFSRSLANSCTDWPCLLVEVLSTAAEKDHFQPKLLINNIEILRKAVSTDDSIVSAALYHDSLLWRLTSLGLNSWCLPVMIITSDSYYSYQGFVDFGYPDIFISRETFGWTPQEAKMHLVPDVYSEVEWKMILEIFGSNQRHLNELYAIMISDSFKKAMQDNYGSFEDVLDAYLAYLQVNIVDPAMQLALTIVQKFVSDAKQGKILESRLQFGAPWRHPPCTDDPEESLRWSKIQLMDFVQSLVNAEYGVNYLADACLEIMDDPCTTAMLEVGLLYMQRDPSFIRPVSRGILRCLARWLVQERMKLSMWESFLYLKQRIIRGRSYRHLMKELR